MKKHVKTDIYFYFELRPEEKEKNPFFLGKTLLEDCMTKLNISDGIFTYVGTIEKITKI
jgi:hypothetical protein